MRLLFDFTDSECINRHLYMKTNGILTVMSNALTKL